MLTHQHNFMDGRIVLSAGSFVSGGKVRFTLDVSDTPNAYCKAASFFLVEEDYARIQEAVEAFNEVMRRPALQEAAE